MKVIKPTSRQVRVINKMVKQYGLAPSIASFVSVARYNEEERLMLLDVKTCTRKVSDGLSERIEGMGMVVKTNLGNTFKCTPTHFVLTEFGLTCCHCVELLVSEGVAPLELEHNNQMVEFVGCIKKLFKVELDERT